MSEALTHHRGALRASLKAEYGINLRGHGLTLVELADLVAWLPAGCALWVSIGGPLGWSHEATLLNEVEFRLRVLAWQGTADGSKNHNQPVRVEPPKYAHEREQEAQALAGKADAWERRQRRQRHTPPLS